jgi:hypothetical protein
LSVVLDLDYLISKFKMENTPPQFLSNNKLKILIERSNINLNKEKKKIIL